MVKVHDTVEGAAISSEAWLRTFSNAAIAERAIVNGGLIVRYHISIPRCRIIVPLYQQLPAYVYVQYLQQFVICYVIA